MVPGTPKINKHKKQYQERLINTNKNTTWSHLGGDLGGAQKVSGAQTLLRLINTLYVQLVTFGGVSF